MTQSQKVDPPTVADRAKRRVMLRLMPYLFLLYIIAYLDRVNVSYAALTMKGDLKFTDDVMGLGAGIFFVKLQTGSVVLSRRIVALN